MNNSTRLSKPAGIRPWYLAVAVAASLAAGCGGGGSSNSQTEGPGNDEPAADASDSPATVTTVSGTVQKPAGTTIGGLGWDDRFLAALGSFISPLSAAVTGLEAPPAGTSVRIIRVDSDGNEVEQLATGETDGDGNFSIEADASFEATGDIVIVAGASDPIRAPAGGRDVSVSPVSENIVRKVLDRVKNGGSSFDRFSATELAALVELIVEELEASSTTTDFTNKSVSDAATDVDNNAGDTDDRLVADSEGESGIGFGGAKNMAGIGLELVQEGEREGRVGIDAEIIPGTIAAGPVLDFSGKTIEVFETDISWTFTDDNTEPSFTVANDTTNDEVPATEDAFTASVGNSGRLIVNAETTRRGGVSADGERFAFTGTASSGNNNYAQLVVGASEWTPGDVSETYNVLKFTPLVDDTDPASTSDFSNPGNLAIYTAQLSEMSVNCTDGNCDIDSSSTGSTVERYSKSDPSGFDDPPDVGTGRNPVDFTQAMTLNDDGTMAGTWSDGVARGLLAPDARMLVFHYQIGQDNSYPGQSFYYGLPKGQSCDAGTFSGTYNMAGLGVSQFDGDDDMQVFDGAVETETLGFAADADGSDSLSVPDPTTVDTELTFIDGLPMVNRAADAGTGGDLTYQMNSDCTFTIASGGSGSGSDFTRVSTTGFVSPDGEMVVIGDHSQEFSSTGSDDVFTQVLIGFRAPSN